MLLSHGTMKDSSYKRGLVVRIARDRKQLITQGKNVRGQLDVQLQPSIPTGVNQFYHHSPNNRNTEQLLRNQENEHNKANYRK